MLELDQIYNGFRLIRMQEIKEIQSVARIFRYERTKTEVIILSNSDDNNVFMITFKTLPEDDTGVSHILEHSVLNGSRKYPVKEPFAELLKSSLYTFLNAMTYPDRTVYPVASRNQQDFINLMDVYLDAVFNPLINEDTFLQEGWHYAINPEGGDLTYSGVVYNEMLGAYSDPENLLMDEIGRALFPDSIYGKSSGGDPKHIPQLTYPKFIEFYRRYYHPSNAKILLYGNFDIMAKLAHLADYLSAYEFQECQGTIALQPRFSRPICRHGAYPTTPGETTIRSTYAVRSYLLSQPTEPEYYLAFTILSRILSGTPASPLRKALVDSHLGESTIHYGFEHDSLENYYVVGLKGTDPDLVQSMEDIIDSTLRQLVANGLDPNTIQASMNQIEFQLREANFGGYPKGLCYGLTMLNSWVYDADPLMHLGYEHILNIIKTRLAAGRYFETMIENYFIKNPHHATIILHPDPQLEKVTHQCLKDKLAATKRQMNHDEIEHVQQRQNHLLAKQLEPDSALALSSIPKLPMSAIDSKAEIYPFELIPRPGHTLSFSRQPTNGITYLMLTFNAAGIPQSYLPLLPSFSQLLFQVGTQTRSYVELLQDIDIHTGGVGAGYSSTIALGHRDSVINSLTFSAKCLRAKTRDLVQLLREIITLVNWENPKRISEVLHISSANKHSQIIPQGHNYAEKRLAAYHSRLGQYHEITNGVSQYHALKEYAKVSDHQPESLIEQLKIIAADIFTLPNLHIHLTGGDEELTEFLREADFLTTSLPVKESQPQTYNIKPITPNEGLIIPTNVQYVAKGANLYDLGYPYNGSIEVLDTLLSRDYLWNKIRVQGGAYGSFCHFDYLTGNFSCVSYRDPNLSKTLAVYDQIGHYLSTIDLSDGDYEKLIIGTMGSIDSPKTPDQKGAIAFSRYLKGITNEDIQRRREEILSSRKNVLTDYTALFDSVRDKGSICVIGNEDKLKQAQPFFASIKSVFADSQNQSALNHENYHGLF